MDFLLSADNEQHVDDCSKTALVTTAIRLQIDVNDSRTAVEAKSVEIVTGLYRYLVLAQNSFSSNLICGSCSHLCKHGRDGC